MELSVAMNKFLCQTNTDGGSTTASGLWEGHRDVRDPVRRHAAHHQEEEGSL